MSVYPPGTVQSAPLLRSQILAVDGVSGKYALRSYSYANYYDADGNHLEISTEGTAQVPEGYENAGKIVANSNSQEDSYFTDSKQ